MQLYLRRGIDDKYAFNRVLDALLSKQTKKEKQINPYPTYLIYFQGDQNVSAVVYTNLRTKKLCDSALYDNQCPSNIEMVKYLIL